MICEKCIIATNTRGPREIIENNKNGLLFDVDDYKETANSIDKIYNNDELRKNIEKKGTNKVSNYLLENILEELVNNYEKLEKIEEIKLVGV